MRLVGISKEGTLRWRNERLEPTRLHAVKGTTVYVEGLDLTDDRKPKIFLIHSRSGDLLKTISTGGMCTECGVAPGPDGTVYINDLSSTRIFKIQ
jgi:hypothetical protein